MASFNAGPRFPGPIFNQNFPSPPNNFNINSRRERPLGQAFQTFPNTPFRPFSSPERFISGSFPSRPRFPNFPNLSVPPPGFRGRPPVPENLPPANNLNVPPRPRFSGFYDQPFRPWKQRPSFPRQKSTLPNHFQRPLPPSSQFPGVPFMPNRKQRRDQRPNKRDSRKLKDDNTEKLFSCDTCDRAFITEHELQDHLSLHITCDERNCTFAAHPKIVAIHKKMQHETGYADAISKLKDEAEIKKWREERRSRFPTAENIRKRQAEQAEREARGEVLETKEFGKFKRQKTEDGNMRHRGRGRRTRGHHSFKNYQDRNSHFRSHPNFRPVVLTVDSDSDSDSDSHISLKKFAGIPTLINSVNDIFHENEGRDESIVHNGADSVYDMDSSPSIHKQNLSKLDSDESVNIQNILFDGNPNIIVDSVQKTALLNGDNMKDSDDEAPVSIPIIKSKENESSTRSEDLTLASPETQKSADSTASTLNKENLMKKDNAPRRFQRDRPQYEHRNKSQGSAFEARKSTLLEKLLADDIRHERNVILQCVRHIVNKKFFGIGGN